MRCKPIRTVFRAALAAGLLATCQNAPLSACWKDYLHASADACFIHDLHWENFHSASNSAEHFAKSIVKTDGDARLAMDYETKACVAAAKLFELKMQADAVLATLRSRSYQLTDAGAKLFHGYSQSRTLILSTIENKSLMLVDWIKIPDMLPVTVIATESTKDFECDWDCGDRQRTNSPPLRDLANIFVYTFVDAIESNASNDSYASYDYYASYEGHGSFGSETLPSTLALSDENDDASADSDEFYSGEFYYDESLASDSEIVATESASPISIANAWQVGVDPICPEVQVRHPSWNGIGSEHSICCPIERAEECIGTEIGATPAVIAVRPPTLDAEFESREAANDLKIYQFGTGYCLTGLENPSTPDFANTALNAIDEIREASLYSFDGFNSPWCDSLNWSPWSSRVGKRFAFGDNAPRMPEAGPAVAAYTKEDLESASTYSSMVLGDFPNGTQRLYESELDETKFSNKDVLISRHDSAYCSIMLPYPATKAIAKPTTESKSRVSKNIASQIRTVGQFLVDFASQIESQVEQIEFARRENNQR